MKQIKQIKKTKDLEVGFLISWLSLFLLSLGTGLVIISSSALALIPTDGGSTSTTAPSTSTSSSSSSDAKAVSKASDGSLGNDCADKNVNKCLKDDAFVGKLREIVKFLSAGVGVVVVLMLIIAGIRYSAAGSDTSAVAAAKKQIYNAIFALIAFALTWSFLQWLVPGGIL